MVVLELSIVLGLWKFGRNWVGLSRWRLDAMQMHEF